MAFIPYSWAAIAAVPLPAQGSNSTPPGFPAIASSLLNKLIGFWAGWPTNSPADVTASKMSLCCLPGRLKVIALELCHLQLTIVEIVAIGLCAPNDGLVD